MGAVVLNVDLHSLEGVDSVLSHVADLTPDEPSFDLSSFVFVLFIFSFPIVELPFVMVEELLVEDDEFVALTVAIKNKIGLHQISAQF